MLGGDRIQGERKEAGVQLAMEDFSSRVPVRTPCLIIRWFVILNPQTFYVREVNNLSDYESRGNVKIPNSVFSLSMRDSL